MVRLAIAGLEDATLAALAARSQPAQVEPWSRASGRTSSEADTPQASVFLGRPTIAGSAGASGECDRSIEDALRAGRWVLVEPQSTAACLSAAAIDAWERLAISSGGRLTIRNLERNLPSRTLIRQQLDAGKFGAAGLIRGHRWTPATSRSVGGAISVPAALVADIDVAQWLMGRSAELVYAAAPAGGEALQLHLGFPAGGMALLDWARLPDGDGYSSLSLIGSAGAAYADDHSNRQLAFRGGAPRAILADERLQGMTQLLRGFAKDITTPQAAAPSPSATSAAARDSATADWFGAVRLAAAAERSLETNRAVRLEELP